MSKDYLNNKEKQGIIAALKVMQILEEMAENDLFTKEEKTDIRKAITYTENAIFGKIDKKTGQPIEGDKKGVLKRLNTSAAKSFNNSLKNVELFISDKYEIKVYSKRVESELNAAYEDSKDYFHLVEAILDQNCKNCNRCGSKCPFYKLFEDKAIPEYDGAKKFDNCRYAFKTDEKGNVI